jgi:hypothetical protein
MLGTWAEKVNIEFNKRKAAKWRVENKEKGGPEQLA